MTDPETPKRPTAKTQDVSQSPARIPTVRLEELIGEGRELHITHGDEVYRLIVTRNNKLILQK